MFRPNTLRMALAAGACALAMAGSAQARTLSFDVPAGELKAALDAYADQSGVQLIYRSDELRGARTRGVHGARDTADALRDLLAGTGFVVQRQASGAVAIVRSARPQSDATAQTEPPGQPTAVEEVIVTAQKKSERLIDVPQAVSVVSTEGLTRQGITQFRDYADTIPGLSFFSFGAGYTQISLRGVTTGFDLTPTVAIYVDEVPYGSSTAFAGGTFTAADIGLFDLDRIEVLRGPQGTLYGASSIGGLLKYVTKQPDPSGFSAAMLEGVSSTRHGGMNYNLSASVNAPLGGDKAAVRASLFESHDGGYIDNLALGSDDVNRSDVYGGRLDFLFQPTDQLTVRLSGFLQDINRDGTAQADYGFAGAPIDGPLDQRHRAAEPFSSRFRLASGTVTYDAGPATVTSVTSYQTIRTNYNIDLSLIYVPVLKAVLGRDYSSVALDAGFNTNRFAQELRVASAQGGRFEWVVGGFYTREDSENPQTLILRDLAGQISPNDVLTLFSPSTFSEYAAFGDLTWRLTDRFDVTGGMRYAHDREEFSQIGTGIFSSSKAPVSSSENISTYLANARYHFSNHATAYARFATGYRPGGPNSVFNDPTTGLPLAPPTFESDNLKSYEAGFKAETADRRFAVDLAAYYIDWNNIQIIGSRNGFSVNTNAPGGADIRGVELSLTAHPVPRLTLASALTYQDARMSAADPDLSARKGERLPLSPRFTATLDADYVVSDSRYRPSIGASLRYVGNRTTGFDAGSFASAQYHLPDYALVDLRAGVTVGAAELQLTVRNLFDQRAQLSAYPVFSHPLVTVGQPRTIGISATERF